MQKTSAAEAYFQLLEKTALSLSGINGVYSKAIRSMGDTPSAINNVRKLAPQANRVLRAADKTIPETAFNNIWQNPGGSRMMGAVANKLAAEKEKKGYGRAAGIGAAVGGVAAGPVGAATGAGVGAFANFLKRKKQQKTAAFEAYTAMLKRAEGNPRVYDGPMGSDTWPIPVEYKEMERPSLAKHMIGNSLAHSVLGGTAGMLMGGSGGYPSGLLRGLGVGAAAGGLTGLGLGALTHRGAMKDYKEHASDPRFQPGTPEHGEYQKNFKDAIRAGILSEKLSVDASR